MVKTNPSDASGAAHCVEHLCLRGSRKYPCGNVLYLARNSCAYKFINAGTYDDRTIFVGVLCDAASFMRCFDLMLDCVVQPVFMTLGPEES